MFKKGHMQNELYSPRTTSIGAVLQSYSELLFQLNVDVKHYLMVVSWL